jgi:hypothetical protein
MTDADAYRLALSVLPQWRATSKRQKESRFEARQRLRERLGRPLTLGDIKRHMGGRREKRTQWQQWMRVLCRFAVRAMEEADFPIAGDDVRLVTKWIIRADHGHPAPLPPPEREPDDGTDLFNENTRPGHPPIGVPVITSGRRVLRKPGIMGG